MSSGTEVEASVPTKCLFVPDLLKHLKVVRLKPINCRIISKIQVRRCIRL